MQPEENTEPKRSLFTRRRFLYSSAALALIDGFLVEPNLSSITKREIKLPFLHSELDGLKVIHLTDFHYKPNKDETLMKGVIEKVNELRPDLILLTGDYVDGDNPEIGPLIDQLQKLRSKYGIYACMGNHDGWQNPGSHYKKLFEKIGIQLLINENVKIEINGHAIYIAATDYIWQGAPDPVATLKGVPDTSPLITLVHEPDYFDTMLKHRDNHLQLSGHTHGGQCRIPIINYAPKKVKHGKKYIYDRYYSKKSTVFVSKGIGTTAIRVRFSCLPEIAEITLRS